MFVIFISIFLVLLYIYYKRYYSFFKKLKIPGPIPIPIYGNTWGSWKMMDHLVTIERIKRYGKTFGIYRGVKPILMTIEPEIMRNILIKDSPIFLSRHQILPFNAIVKDFGNLSPDQMKKFREFTTSVLTPKSIKDMVSEICHVSNILCDMLLEAWKNKIDGMMISSMFVMDMLTQTMLGINIGTIGKPDHPFLHKNIKVEDGPLVNILSIFTFSSKYKHETKMWDDLLKGKVDSVVSKGGNDYISKLSKHFEKYRGTDHVYGDPKLFKVISGLLSSNTTYDVSSFIMSATLHLLAINPDCQVKARDSVKEALNIHGGEWNYEAVQDMEYLEQCILETTRLYPSGATISRVCSRDTIYNGISIKNGTVVEIPIYAIHRNPDFYDDPELFIPERFSRENKSRRDGMYYQAFGHGPRSCVGMKFATTALKVGIGHLLLNFSFHKIQETTVPLRYQMRQCGNPACLESWIGIQPIQS